MDQLISVLAEYLYLVVPVIALIATLLADRASRWSIAKLALVALSVALAVDLVLERSLYIPRPFVVAQVSPLIPHAADSSFPSSHTLLTMTIAAVVFAFNRRVGIVLGLLSLCVGWARVLALLHSPLDIIGSALIALTIVYGAWTVLRRWRIIRVDGFHTGV